jgi:hypothetical protein
MTSLQARIQDDLAEAMRDRDMARVKVLRTTMSAIQNGEAVEGVASVEGVVGYSDVQRRALSDEDVMEIIIREIEESSRCCGAISTQTDRRWNGQRLLEPAFRNRRSRPHQRQLPRWRRTEGPAQPGHDALPHPHCPRCLGQSEHVP